MLTLIVIDEEIVENINRYKIKNVVFYWLNDVLYNERIVNVVITR